MVVLAAALLVIAKWRMTDNMLSYTEEHMTHGMYHHNFHQKREPVVVLIAADLVDIQFVAAALVEVMVVVQLVEVVVTAVEQDMLLI